MAEDATAHDPAILASQSKVLLRRLSRSIRSSIAMSSRRADWDPDDLYARAAQFGETLEWRNDELGWDVGSLRLRAQVPLRAELAELNGTYLTHAAALLTVAEHINAHSASAWRRTRRSIEKLDAICEIHSQAIAAAEEALALVASGLPVGAASRWRTMYELAIVGAFLARSPRGTSQRYLESHVSEFLRENSLLLGETPTRRGRRTALIAERSRLSEEQDRLRRKYGESFLKPYGWAAERLGRKRVTFNDIEKRVRGGGKRILHGGDLHRYKIASQHVHGERASSLKSFAKDPSDPKVLVGGIIDPSLVQVDIVWTLQDLTWTLAELTARTQEVPEALYWGYVGHMFALDADTETWHHPHQITTGYLRSLFSLSRGPSPR